MKKRDPRDGAPPAPDAERAGDAEDRAAILRRRAMFVASAIAGLGLAGCADPQPCLSIAIPQEPSPADAGDAAPPEAGTPEPMPCLSVSPAEEPSDAGADDGGPAPQPCLKMAPPRPCLKMAPPRPCLDMPAPED